MSIANVGSFLVFLGLVTAVYSSNNSELAKRAMPAPFVFPANPGVLGIIAPPCYTQFFVGNIPPQQLEYDNPAALRYICQPVEGFQGAFFATLFDETAGIAILSAYVVTAQHAQGIVSGARCSDPWHSTPGIQRQGSSQLYAGSAQQNIDKGHLNPCKINSFSPPHMRATFAYTNAVPQYGTFNRGSWKRYEGKIIKHTQDHCATQGGIMFLITGTSKYRITVTNPPNRDPGPIVISRFPGNYISNAIVRPNSMWTAGCCVINNVQGWSIAVMGNNIDDRNLAQTKPMTVAQLEHLLIPVGAIPANLFPGFHACRYVHHHLWWEHLL